MKSQRQSVRDRADRRHTSNRPGEDLTNNRGVQNVNDYVADKCEKNGDYDYRMFWLATEVDYEDILAARYSGHRRSGKRRLFFHYPMINIYIR